MESCNIMDRQQALAILQLTSLAPTPAEVEAGYGERRRCLEALLIHAPTEPLRREYGEQLGRLEQARAALLPPPALGCAGLSPSMLRDLPGSNPSYNGPPSQPEPVVMLHAGLVLGGRYEIRHLLGEGGMGAVYAAWDRLKDEEMALKVIHPRLLAHPEARQRFITEAKVATSLSHPSIITIHDLHSEGELYFITMEKLVGRTLREELRRRQNEGEPWRMDEVCKVGQALSVALAYAHGRGTVHRDIKPENIWLEPDGGLKLLDFGLARLMTPSQLSATGMALGTAYYMAPEQLGSQQAVDGRADQYGLGAVLYELLTGKVPCGRFPTPAEVRPEVPACLSEAILRALSTEPGQRHADMVAFGRALGEKVTPTARRREDGVSKWRAGGGAWIYGLGVLTLLGLGLTAPSWWPALRPYARQVRSWLLPTAEKKSSGIPQGQAANYTETAGGVNIEMVWVPGGSFQMGSDDTRDADEKPVHEVRVDGFWMGKYEVTQEQYEVVMGENPSVQKDARNPVEHVCWDDAAKFCQKLSEKTGKRYSLPSEAQWEYACRAGSTGKWCFGDNEGGLDNYGWYRSNSGATMHPEGQTYPVGRKAANAFGLYDMHGNVWEWCADWYHESYAGAPSDGSAWESPAGQIRVMRGGSWGDDAVVMRSSGRMWEMKVASINGIGFRVMASRIAGSSLTPTPNPTPNPTPSPRPIPSPAPVERVTDASNDYTETANGVNLEMMWIPGGTFQMGNHLTPAETDAKYGWGVGRVLGEYPLHSVNVGGFWLGKYEVTVGQFQRFAEASGYQTTAEREGWAYSYNGQKHDKVNGASWRNPGFAQTGSHPVVYMSWDDATAFCRWLGEKAGKGYHLPSEAQWEYAYRAGTRTSYPWGEDANNGKGWGNCFDLSAQRQYRWPLIFNWDDGYVYTAPVGQFNANRFGLYDMIGNANEWCADWYHNSYAGAPSDGSAWESPVGEYHVLRGGSWIANDPFDTRSSFRESDIGPSNRIPFDGFRVMATRSN